MALRLRLDDEAKDVLPPITNFAVEYVWLYPAVLAGVCILAAVAFVKRPEKTASITIFGLCAQGIVIWHAYFCFCFSAFTSGGNLHHDPSFNIFKFVCFGAGVFPVTLATVLLPGLIFQRGKWGLAIGKTCGWRK
jgi:hypothetical protein